MQKKAIVLVLLLALLLSACSAPGAVTGTDEQSKAMASLDNAVTLHSTEGEENQNEAAANNEVAAKPVSSSGASLSVSNKVPTNSFPATDMVNVTQEIELTSTVTYRTPYTEAAIHAIFTGPNGQKMTVPGFWDGDQTWKIRFAAPDEGKWTYEVVCTNTADTGLHGQKGTITAKAYTGDNELLKRGRLRVSDDKDDLTYGDGTPFFWMADTHWWLFSSRMKLNFSNNKDYASMFKGTIDQRAEEGYTAIQGILWVTNNNETLSCHNEGGLQWLDGALWETPNPEFWQNVDERMEYIVSKGMVPVVGFDWSGALTESNYDNFARIVRYVIARYSSYPIIWNISGEYNANGALMENMECYGRLGQYVSEIDAYNTLETIHASYLGFPQYTSDYFRGQAWLDYVMSEGGHHNNFGYYEGELIYGDWEVYNNRDYEIPWLEAEAKYEDIWEIPTEQTREVAYLAIMNGSFGYSYGAEGGWQDTWNSQDVFQTYGRLPTPWHKALNKIVGSQQLPHMKKFFTALPYWDLELDKESVKWSVEREDDSVLRPTVNTTADKRVIAIYYPLNNRGVNFDTYPVAVGTLTGLDPKVTYTAKWFDTQSGEYTLISDSVKADAKGEYVLPWPEKLDTNDCMFVMTANDAPSIGQEYYKAAKAEKQNIVLPMVTGEKQLPEVKMQNNDAVVIDLGKALGVQGENGLYYYSYNHITEEFKELPVVKLPYWGEFTWQGSDTGFITDNLFCGGPNDGVCIAWEAPADGVLEVVSRPKWNDCWAGKEGSIITYMHNDEKLHEFVFHGDATIEGQYLTSIEVKKGDRFYIMNRYNTAYNVQGNQSFINTTMYFTEATE